MKTDAIQAETKVFILGAGCSRSCGYPLFSEFKPFMQSFALTLQHSPQQEAILCSVRRTLTLLDYQQPGQEQVSTIDELVRLIRRGDRDAYLEEHDPHKECRGADKNLNCNARRREAIRSAKIATAALFLQKEKEAVTSGLLTRYLTFIADDIHFAPELHWEEKLRRSKIRVLTFNYDRMFEYAFAKYFGDALTGNVGLYTSDILNAGINLQHQQFANIERERFCFLKMHGSVGMTVRNDEYGESTFCDDKQILDWKPPNVDDKLFFPAQNEQQPEPLIAFPHETSEVLSGQDKLLPFDRYISHVWKHAELVLSEASEIFIVGYSIPELDAECVLGFLKQAKACRRITIRNHSLQECERIKGLLVQHLKNGIPISLEPRVF